MLCFSQTQMTSSWSLKVLAGLVHLGDLSNAEKGEQRQGGETLRTWRFLDASIDSSTGEVKSLMWSWMRRP